VLGQAVKNNLWLLRECRDPATFWLLKGRGLDHPGIASLNLRSVSRPVLIRREGTDQRVVWEIFCGREYRVRGRWRFRTVLDGGANAGLFAAFLAGRERRGGGAALERYVGVEPDAEAFEFLRGQCDSLGLAERACLIRAALRGSDGEVSFDTRPESWGRRVDEGGGVRVEAVSVASALDRAGLDDVDLMKLDIEGSERDVLAAAGAWRARVRALVCELHDGLTYDWFASTLRPHGYRTFPAGAMFRAHPGAVREDSVELVEA
jgi:FkbM family methyltransferase